MSKTQTTSGDDVELPEQNEQFNATDEAFPWGENLHGTDRRRVRQFIENLRDEGSHKEFEVKKVYRSNRFGTVRIQLIPGEQCHLSNLSGERATDGTGYKCKSFVSLTTGNLSYHLKDA